MYPAGTGDSVAVQVAPGLKPVIVVENAVASEADPEAGDGVPLVQDTLTLTDAALLGTKSLCTASVALFSVFVIVHVPADSDAWQVPVDVYVAGITDSVAVQVGLPTYEVTVNDAGVASDAEAEPGDTDPLVQDRLTLTEAPLFGTKSLCTANVAGAGVGLGVGVADEKVMLT